MDDVQIVDILVLIATSVHEGLRVSSSRLTECPSIRSHSDMPTMLGVPLKSGVLFNPGLL